MLDGINTVENNLDIKSVLQGFIFLLNVRQDIQ